MERILQLENSHLFFKLSGKSQIITAGQNEIDFYRTRQTHSYEVKTIAEIIAKQINFKKIEELSLVCLAHDLGHSAFGHEGATMLNKMSLKYGISEGFSDNNNTFNVISHNGLVFNNYELVSLIKYPKKLYESQKKELIPLLNFYIKKESKRWGKNLKRTVACNIMDISDEIAYATSDIFDSFATGYTTLKLGPFLNKLADRFKSKSKLSAILRLTANASERGDKRIVREYLFKLKMLLIKDIYWDYEESNLLFKSFESKELLKSLIKFNYSEFIYNNDLQEKRKFAISKFKKFAKFLFLSDPEYFPSDLYRSKYLSEKTKLGKLKIRRDMISDTSDQYVLNFKVNN